MMKMSEERVEILHDLFVGRAQLLGQVLDVTEHRLKLTDCGFVRLCSEDTLELAPDNSII